jgi:hypothetical protein
MDGRSRVAAPALSAAALQVRGLLISLKEAFIVGGILGGYAVSSLVVGEVGGWRTMYGASAPIAGVLAAGMVSRGLVGGFSRARKKIEGSGKQKKNVGG